MEIIAIALLILLPIVLFTTFITLNHNRAVRMDLSKQLRELEFKHSELCTQAKKLEEEKSSLQDSDRKLTIENAELRKEKEFMHKEISNLKENIDANLKIDAVWREEMKNAFKVLSSESLQSQAEDYRLAAKATFREREDAIAKLFSALQEKVDHLENLEVANTSDFKTQMDLLRTESKRLGVETKNLANALKVPSVSGKWGEVQLQRVLELAGLREDIDYSTQKSSATYDGKTHRPDIVINLPGKREIIIDSKVPVTALLDKANASDEQQREEAVKHHLRLLKSHVETLANKEYWRSREQSLDFVVMVLPEFAYLPAIEADNNLLERAMDKRVIIATPQILLALLRSIANLRGQEEFVASAKRVRNMGKELLERLVMFTEHFINSGRGLKTAVDCYNKAVSSWDKRLAPSMQRFVDLGVPTDKEIPEAKELTDNTLVLQRLVADSLQNEMDETDSIRESVKNWQEQVNEEAGLGADEAGEIGANDDVVTQIEEEPLPLPLQKVADDE